MSSAGDHANSTRTGESATSSALRTPGSGTMKAVQIADPPDSSISPLMKGSSKEVEDFDLDRPAVPRQHRANIASSRLTGRPSAPLRHRTSKSSLNMALEEELESALSTRPNSISDNDGLAAKISAWIKREKDRRASRRSKRKSRKHKHARDADANADHSDPSSEGESALDHLQDIINRSLVVSDRSSPKKGITPPTKRSMRTKLRRPSAAASETDFGDNEDLVPTCDVILDNTKVCSTGGEARESEASKDGSRPGLQRASSSYQKDAWKDFKFEIVRLTHTLRLRGWRRVPMQMSSEIQVIRLSGALTNAVYEVLPPKELPEKTTDTVDGTSSSHPKAKPQKLLLRIYGVGVENLIDREAELQILRRLRRKNIGPRLLGCFSNGRFEEFLHAEPLTPQLMRDASTSVQIAKRMRELHEGMDLLPLEREEGTFVWCNISRWTKQCAQTVTWLDTQAKELGAACTNRPHFICGTEWEQFYDVLMKYKDWLFAQYGGAEKLKDLLVFAHNDTQYGNILRMTPEDESPLLTAANEHKRLQVIDFEYANANMRGVEFANHFTEWCYNYHDEKAPHACNVKCYPTLEEQRRFLHAYVTHQPTFSTSKTHEGTSAQPSEPATPALGPTMSSLSTSLISNFMLDSRSSQPTGRDQSAGNGESQRCEEIEREIENEITRLQHETRMWRLANSAQWTMWGVLRAKIPDLPDFDDPTQSAAVAAGPLQSPQVSKSASQVHLSEDAGSDPLDEEAQKLKDEFHDRRPDILEEGDDEDEEEFDYLGYSWERALFFWGDAVGLGLVKKEELPADVVKYLKVVEN